MGTHATTRIADATDYIEAHTRWDGFGDDIRRHLSQPGDIWQKSIDEFKLRLSQSEQGTEGILHWVEQLETFLHDTQANPTVDKVMALLCMRSFTHHQVLPHKTSADLLQHWGEGNPGYVGILENNRISFADVKGRMEPENIEDEEPEEQEARLRLAPMVTYDIHQPVVARKMDTDYKVARIYTVYDANESDEDEQMSLKTDSQEYIDIKFKNISEVQLAQSIASLPLFFRDLHTIGKNKTDTMEGWTWHGQGIFKFMEKLGYFYSATQEYQRFDNCRNKTETIFTDKERQDNFHQVLDLVNSLIPFDFFINAMANHLFIALPGQVLPVTQAEIKAGYDIDMYIGVEEHRQSNIYVNLPKLDNAQIEALYQNFSQQAAVRETQFNASNGLEVQPTMNYVINEIEREDEQGKKVDSLWLGFAYEASLIMLMSTQRDMEIIAKEQEKKNKARI